MVQQKVNMFGNDVVPLSLQSPLVVLLLHEPFSLRGIRLHPELLTGLNPFVCPCEKNITVCVFKRRSYCQLKQASMQSVLISYIL